MTKIFYRAVVWFFLLYVSGPAAPVFAEGQQDRMPGPAFPSSGMDTLMKDAGSALDIMEEEAVPAEDTAMTLEDGYYLGRAVAAEILKIYKPYTQDPALTTYLNKICLAVTVNSAAPSLYAGYHVEILDTAEICAFATPGGHIFLSRGIIACASSEDGLAAVIAHEAAHIQLRHAETFIQNERTVQELTATADRAASIASRNLTPEEQAGIFRQSVTASVNALFRDGYSRDQESEADKAALTLLRDAGYNPAALREVLESISVKPQPGAMGNTHPSPASRIVNLGVIQGGAGRGNLPARQARYREAVKNLP